MIQMIRVDKGLDFPALKLLMTQKMAEEYLLRKNNKCFFIK